MKKRTDELETIRTEGLKALKERLGIVGMIKFIQMYSSGKGDYTAERRKEIEKLSREDFHEFLRERGEINENEVEPSDYTKWQENLFEGMTGEEICNKAKEYCEKANN